jgi:ATP-binding protein involved in chromosome partitioning
MSWLIQADGSKLEIFGNGGGKLVADRLAKLVGHPVELLGQIPLSVDLREGSDQGQPVVLAKPADAAALEISAIAARLASEPIGLAGKKLRISL